MIRKTNFMVALVSILTISIFFLGCEKESIADLEIDKKERIIELAQKHGIPETAIEIDLSMSSNISDEEIDEYFQMLASIISKTKNIKEEKRTNAINGLPILSLSIIPRLKGSSVEQTRRNAYNSTWQNVTVTTNTSNGSRTFDSHTTGIGMWNYEHGSNSYNSNNGTYTIYGTTTFSYGLGQVTYNVTIEGSVDGYGNPTINSISYSF